MSKVTRFFSAFIPLAVLLACPCAWAQTSPLAPQPGLSAQSTCPYSPTFGVQPFWSAAPSIPVDADIAVAPCYVLVVSNKGIRAYDKLGQPGGT